MSEFAHWLAAEPVRWLVPLTLLSCVAGIPLMLWWERRHPPKSRRPEVLEAWRGLPASVQAAHDEAVLDAAEAAQRIVLDEAHRVGHLHVEPASSVVSD